MGTTVRAGASIRVDQIEVSDTQFKVTLRLSDVTMKVLGESFTPVAGLIKSGALDLSKPGNLAKFMPKRPAGARRGARRHHRARPDAEPEVRRERSRARHPRHADAGRAGLRAVDRGRLPDPAAARVSPFGMPRALNAARALAAG